MTVDKWPSGLLSVFFIFNVILKAQSLYLSEDLRANDGIKTIKIEEFPTSMDQLNHYIKKRDISDTASNITTSIAQLNATQLELLVHWAGEGSNVIICLARNNQPETPLPSGVYISYDGHTFENKTEFFKLDDNTYASIDKFSSLKGQKRHIVFMDKYNKVLFTTKDFGKQIRKVKLGFKPVELLFYPNDPYIFLAYDVNKTLWITRDFGESFSIVQEFVKSYFWAGKWPGNWNQNGRTLLVQRQEPTTTTIISLTNLLSSDQPGITVLFRDAKEFKVIDDFMFVTSKLTQKSNDLYISYKGDNFYKAVFDSELERLNYHVVDASENRLLIAVAHSATLANLYVSEVTSSNQYMFRLSLERLFCYFPKDTWVETWLSILVEDAFADIHKVQGLRGIFLASQVTGLPSQKTIMPEHLVTLITFDWGGEWKPLKPPKEDENGQPIKNCSLAEGCSLHLSQKFSNLYPLTRSPPIKTSASAPGIIIATGTLDKSLKGHAGIFISRDAGLTWHKVLKENYLFDFGDHGGVITAVKFFKANGGTKELLYSTDEGETWKTHTFYKDDIRVYSLMTEPGENTTVFTLFGSEISKHGWLIVNVDLRNAFTYNCTKDDYKMWSPSSETGMKMPCIMGRKETYERRVAHSNCYNGKDYDRPISMETCLCDIEDFECDFGFIRHVSSPECVRNKTAVSPYSVPKTCKPGNFYNRTRGYRKIDGDVCVEGYEKNYLPDTIPCPFTAQDEFKEFVLLVQRERILKFNLANIGTSSNQTYEVLPLNLENIVAVEFDMKNNCVYFADIKKDIIGRQCLSSDEGKVEILVESELGSVEGMSLDWVANHLYFVDGEKLKIEVIRTDLHNSGRMRKTILDRKVLDKPRGIAVHPVAGYFFWTDWSDKDSSVSRANLDGSEVKKLFSKPDVLWPNGVTIDFIADHIYFVDAKLDYIATCDLQGRHFRKILSNEAHVSHPFAVAVFKDNMYWDDWRDSSFYVADKDHGYGIQKIFFGGRSGMMDLKVYAHSLQQGNNTCGSKNNCTHLCFQRPNDHVCACPDQMMLLKGKCLCIDGSTPYANNTCPKRSATCPPGLFSCKSGGEKDVCIPELWRCDGEKDCVDFSDEENCVSTTCKPDAFKCGDGKCIPMYWYCDLDKDCADGSDEANCTYKECEHNQFQCANKRCISMRWKCDGEDDCKDGSDEVGCTVRPPSPTTCNQRQFKCDNGATCLPATWRCDGERDCTDNSDERDCFNNTCETWQFQCVKSRKCIFESWKCDREHDCGPGDDSDEANCSYPLTTKKPEASFNTCTSWYFKCNNGKCVPNWWKCDSVNDCGDNSDEIGCGDMIPSSEKPPEPTVPPTCLSNQFRCQEGHCIQLSWVCDGVSDCEKGEDEAHCTEVSCSSHDQFKCRNSGSCVLLSQVCDGVAQCPDSTDEIFCDNKPAHTTPAPANPRCLEGFFPCDGSRCLALALLCNGKPDCYDGFDEANCTNTTNKHYQVLQMWVDERSRTSNSFSLWWVQEDPHVQLEFLPSIAEVPLHTGLPEKWTNNSEWTGQTVFKFTNLLPYTEYNLTVYARKHGSKLVSPPAKYIVATTLETLPGPPWNVSVLQKSVSQVEVSWHPPHKPNGNITQYTVFMTPPLPPLQRAVSSNKQSVIFNGMFLPGSKSTFWVVCSNSAGQSNASDTVTLMGNSEASVGSVKNLHILSTGETWAVLTWDPTPMADGYNVQPVTKLPYAKLSNSRFNNNQINYTCLAPGAEYLFRINAYRKTYEGPLSSITVQTKGEELPTVPGFKVKLKENEGSSVELEWEKPKYNKEDKQWSYGIYYTQRPSILFESPQNETSSLNFTVRNLQACESYQFDVSVVGPLGRGPLHSSPVPILTKYSPSAPPKMLAIVNDPRNGTGMIITWSSSCPVIEAPISYVVEVTEVTLNKVSYFTLHPTNQTSLKHRVLTDPGARYKVRVMTDKPNATPSKAVEHWATPLPIPHQVQVVVTSNLTYLVYWQETEKLKEGYHFEIVLSEGRYLNESSAEFYNTTEIPYVLLNLKSGIYCLAVRLVSEKGHKSSLSESVPFEGPPGSWTSELTPSRVATVMVPFTLVILLLVVALVVFVIRHRQLQNSFSSFANSYYSTRSGAATFTSTDGLDDEDSPVIRGFSDDEPLVIA